jgi:hypothetical protein
MVVGIQEMKEYMPGKIGKEESTILMHHKDKMHSKVHK